MRKPLFLWRWRLPVWVAVLLLLLLCSAGPTGSVAVPLLDAVQDEGGSTTTIRGKHNNQSHGRGHRRTVTADEQQQEEEKGGEIGIGGGDDGAEGGGIIYGSEAAAGEFPGYAIPNVDQSFGLCGALLVHEDILMTAGHCRGLWARTEIFLGPLGLFGEGASETVLGLTELVHPAFIVREYPFFRLTNDIMLVKILREPGFEPIPLATLNQDANIPAPNDALTLVGFGRTETGDCSDVLLTAPSNALEDGECARRDVAALGDNASFKKQVMLCEIGPNGESTWNGDSGSPVFHVETGTVVGIVSWGPDPFIPMGYSVNTRVSAFYDWIQSSICTLSSNPPPDCPPETESPTMSPSVVPTDEPSIRNDPTDPQTSPTSSPTAKPTAEPPTTFVSPSSMPMTVPTSKNSCNFFLGILQWLVGWLGINFCG